MRGVCKNDLRGSWRPMFKSHEHQIFSLISSWTSFQTSLCCTCQILQIQWTKYKHFKYKFEFSFSCRVEKTYFHELKSYNFLALIMLNRLIFCVFSHKYLPPLKILVRVQHHFTFIWKWKNIHKDSHSFCIDSVEGLFYFTWNRCCLHPAYFMAWHYYYTALCPNM